VQGPAVTRSSGIVPDRKVEHGQTTAAKDMKDEWGIGSASGDKTLPCSRVGVKVDVATTNFEKKIMMIWFSPGSLPIKSKTGARLADNIVAGHYNFDGRSN
jgi:hypothetical protein